jgi:hypothetical protein
MVFVIIAFSDKILLASYKKSAVYQGLWTLYISKLTDVLKVNEKPIS